MTTNISSQLEERIKNFGFDHFGFAKLEKPLSLHIYKAWLKENYHGEMAYLADHFEAKKDATQLMPQARSAIVVCRTYYPHPKVDHSSPLKAARMASYARGADYHHWFKDELSQLASKLKEDSPDHEFVAFTDSSPVLERDLAYRAELGWFGKNSCLIHPKKGSLFFIGEIYTSLDPTSDLDLVFKEHPDRCGKCSRCIDVCPTNAILDNRTLDARKCISYLTIEAKTIPEPELRPQIGDWLFGCDLCQTVCPWNEKVFGPDMKKETAPPGASRQDLIEDLRWILTSSNNEIQRKLKQSPIARAGGRGLKRNAMIVAANSKLSELVEPISTFVDDPMLGELASWAMDRLKP